MNKMDKKQDKKDDDEVFVGFQNLDKGSTLQEKRLFNETPLNSKKCCQLLTKVLYLIAQGEVFTKTEATDLFFAVTRLFQSKDISLRRMVYIVLKELMTMSDDVIIVMSSLTKDMNSTTPIYRSNSIRVLCRLTDTTLLSQVERYLKQAIVDKEPAVSSAALVSGIHLMKSSPDIVRRWISEVQEALQSKHTMVQYHAMGLLHQIKQHDRLAISKLVVSMTKATVRSPFAMCLLIKFTSQVMEEDPNSDRSLYSYLETCLRHKSEMVIYEAARAICNLKNVSSKELTPAITVLQLFLSSPKPALRFAAVRTLNKISQTHPLSVTTCNMDMENLISDSNRSIATLAITTLLKTGNESSVERLMKQISSFMGEISDEFKIVVVDAIRSLCLKFPQKQRSLLSFLSNILRDEGGFEYKKTVVESILIVIKEIPEAKEVGLTHLCEFIEDCEFTYLSNKILHLLGKEGPETSTPSRYIRYIYNRISLENASVRASAVSALAKFGAKLESLRSSIVILLQRCLYDNDDEVRDRATFYVKVLQSSPEMIRKFVTEDFKVPIVNLEKSLVEYQKNPSLNPFDIQNVPLNIQQTEIAKKVVQSGGRSIPLSPAVNSSSSDLSSKSEDTYSSLLASIPQFANLGPLFKSTKPIELTESETEYVVNVVKHIFNDHILLQFNCTNTIADQVLENLIVKIDTSGVKGVKSEITIPIQSLPNGAPGTAFVLLRKSPGSYPTGTIQNTLKFTVKQIDPSSGEVESSGVDDEYHIENFDMATSDYMQKTFINNFEQKWNEIGDEFEVTETYGLSSVKSLQDGVNEVLNFLGMQACDRTDKVKPKTNKHIMLLSGNYLGGIPVVVEAKMKFTEGQGVGMQMTVRSTNEDISTTIAAAI